MVVLKFVKSHKYLQISCHSTEIYILYIYIYVCVCVCVLVIMYFFSFVPKIVKILLTSSYLLEGSVAWCFVGICEFPCN